MQLRQLRRARGPGRPERGLLACEVDTSTNPTAASKTALQSSQPDGDDDDDYDGRTAVSDSVYALKLAPVSRM